MSIVTNSGKAAIASAIINETYHLAWGSGDPDWDDNPVEETVDETALVNEIGRRKASVVSYCIPDDQGDIVTLQGRFRETQEPAPFVFFRFAFDYSDAPTAEIRELAVFMGTTTDPELPPGQMYFEPADIVDPGTLMLLERIDRTPRSPNARVTFEQVLPI